MEDKEERTPVVLEGSRRDKDDRGDLERGLGGGWLCGLKLSVDNFSAGG